MNIKDILLKEVADFLTKNGFRKESNILYRNENCSVEIDSSYYVVYTDEGYVLSESHDIYWLAGYLTWNNFIDKNYVK